MASIVKEDKSFFTFAVIFVKCALYLPEKLLEIVILRVWHINDIDHSATKLQYALSEIEVVSVDFINVLVAFIIWNLSTFVILSVSDENPQVLGGLEVVCHLHQSIDALKKII